MEGIVELSQLALRATSPTPAPAYAASAPAGASGTRKAIEMLLGALRLTAVDENELTDIARGNSATWRTGRSTSYGKSLSADSWTTSNATVTPAFRSPTTQTMATLLAPGSCSNASTTTGAPLSLIVSADSRSCPAGHGRRRHSPSGPVMGRPLRGHRPELHVENMNVEGSGHSAAPEIARHNQLSNAGTSMVGRREWPGIWLHCWPPRSRQGRSRASCGGRSADPIGHRRTRVIRGAVLLITGDGEDAPFARARP